MNIDKIISKLPTKAYLWVRDRLDKPVDMDFGIPPEDYVPTPAEIELHRKWFGNYGEYSINSYIGKTGCATDDSMKIGEGFMGLLQLMGVPGTPPKKYMTETTTGNCVKVLVGFEMKDIWLSGCDVAEFLTAVQCTIAGVDVAWSPMKRPGYWSMQAYNAWVEQTNPLIAESMRILDARPDAEFNINDL